MLNDPTPPAVLATVAQWYIWIAVPLLALYAAMIPILGRYGYEWLPQVHIAAGAIGAIGAYLRVGFRPGGQP